MSDRGRDNGNRTVFQPSPLRSGGGAAAGGEMPSMASPAPFSPPPQQPMVAPVAARTMAESDVPEPATPPQRRNPMMVEAAPLLALAAAIRSGRAREPLSQFHARASAQVAAFDRAIASSYPPDTCRRATYALCSTIDDIAQNLPGIGAEATQWASRSLVVKMFRENIGGDRFWQIVEDLLANPTGNGDLIELLHGCLAAGFEGRFRVMPDGARRLDEIMKRLFAALPTARGLSDRELVPQWRGVAAPVAQVGRWSHAAIAAAVATVLLLLLFIAFRLLLVQSGRPAWEALAALNPSEPLHLSRGGGGLPASESGQAARLETFLAPEIAQGLVTVDRDAGTVRVRTTIGQLFRSGSDALETGRAALFERIAAAVDKEPGPVRVEGHADSDQPSGLTFPDNNALSAARAAAVADIMRAGLADPARVTAEGRGDSEPIASNGDAAGKALNRRVEIVLQRQD